MQVSQIYISDSKDELPSYLNRCVERVKACYPDMPHVLYDDDALREFLGKNFDADVLAAYDKLNPYAYRSDLARYCLLYQLGGWYFDVSVMPLTGLHVESDVDTLAFRDVQLHANTSWACNNAIIFARSKHPVLETAIKMVIENCRNEYYGISPLCPTGPNLFGQSFAVHGAKGTNNYNEFYASRTVYR